MSFASRNTFYLRVNAHVVLPVFLHLDEGAGHTEWMTTSVLDQVIRDLQPRLEGKIQAEDAVSRAPGKKSSGVDVHRGTNYQFGYYLQKAEQHHMLIKTRHFIPVSKPSELLPQAPPVEEPLVASTSKARPRPRPQPKRARKRRRSVSSEEEIELSDNERDDGVSFGDTSSTPLAPIRRSQRSGAKKRATYIDTSDHEIDAPPPTSPHTTLAHDDGNDDEIEELPTPAPAPIVKTEETDPPPLSTSSFIDPILLLEEEDERENDDTKKKLQLQLRFEGFSISSYKLCLIVQPYPPLPPKPNGPITSITGLLPPDTNRQTSLTPFLFSKDKDKDTSRASSISGEKKPLFREDTPFIDEPRRAKVPLFREDTPEEEEEEEAGVKDYSLEGLLQSTQTMSMSKRAGVGIADDLDGEEDDLYALGGDADES